MSHPANIPRTPPFMSVRRRVADVLTCSDGSLWSIVVRPTALFSQAENASSILVARSA
jgi:hypothetical protein